jgi:glutathione S-transferase
MTALKLYAHPFASYCQKAMIAFRENEVPFEFVMLSPENPTAFAELEGLWPFKLFPVLADGKKTVAEASVIIEYLQIHYPGPVRLIPDDPHTALEARFMDRVFDNHVSMHQGKIVYDSLRPAKNRDPLGVTDARKKLETAYRWLDKTMAGREWAAGDTFTLADCAAAPSLFYADWTHEIADEFKNLRAYRERLLRRPSFARLVDEARPYRKLFPLGAPNRD